MKIRLLFTLSAVLSLGLVPALSAADAVPMIKPGYLVVTEISFDEQGTPVEARVVQSDDPTGDHVLEQIAMKMSEQDKQAPHLKDGVAVKFKARRPFEFPVEGDQGRGANVNKPTLHGAQQALPVYPPDLMERNEVGGAIVELTILTDGTVRAVRTLRASHPEFAAAAETALKQWKFSPDTSPGAPAEAHWNVAVGFTTNGQIVPLEWRLAPRPCIGGLIIGRAPPAVPASMAPAQSEAPAQPEAPAPEKK